MKKIQIRSQEKSRKHLKQIGEKIIEIEGQHHVVRVFEPGRARTFRFLPNLRTGRS